MDEQFPISGCSYQISTRTHKYTMDEEEEPKQGNCNQIRADNDSIDDGDIESQCEMVFRMCRMITGFQLQLNVPFKNSWLEVL